MAAVLSVFIRVMDTVNERIGRGARWLVLVTVLVSAGNALARYGFDISSNAWLELQWYLFAAIVLLGAGYTLKHNGHVRIDLIYGRLGIRAQAWVDMLGSLFFLLPMALLLAWLGWQGFAEAWSIGERSPDAGGLLRWPVRLLIPLGFALLGLQGMAEIARRIIYLRDGSLVQEQENHAGRQG